MKNLFKKTLVLTLTAVTAFSGSPFSTVISNAEPIEEPYIEEETPRDEFISSEEIVAAEDVTSVEEVYFDAVETVPEISVDPSVSEEDIYYDAAEIPVEIPEDPAELEFQENVSAEIYPEEYLENSSVYIEEVSESIPETLLETIPVVEPVEIPAESVIETEELPVETDAESEEVPTEAVVEPEEVPAETVMESEEIPAETVTEPEEISTEPVAEPEEIPAEIVTEQEGTSAETVTEPEETPAEIIAGTEETPTEAVVESEEIPIYEPVAPVEQETTTPALETVFYYEDDILYVTAELDPRDALPQDAKLIVKELFLDSQDENERNLFIYADNRFIQYQEKEHVTALQYRIYDIHFEVNGSWVIPAEKAKITLIYKKDQLIDNAADRDSVTVLHIHKEDEKDEYGNDIYKAATLKSEADVNLAGSVTRVDFDLIKQDLVTYVLALTEDTDVYNQRMAALYAAQTEPATEQYIVYEEATEPSPNGQEIDANIIPGEEEPHSTLIYMDDPTKEPSEDPSEDVSIEEDYPDPIIEESSEEEFEGEEDSSEVESSTDEISEEENTGDASMEDESIEETAAETSEEENPEESITEDTSTEEFISEEASTENDIEITSGEEAATEEITDPETFEEEIEEETPAEVTSEEETSEEETSEITTDQEITTGEILNEEASEEETLEEESSVEETSVEGTEEETSEEETIEEETLEEETSEEEASEEETSTEETTEEEIRTRTTYEYEDDFIKVTAELQQADTVPDDAILTILPISNETEGYSYDTFLHALADSVEDPDYYTADNTAVYDLFFQIPLRDEEGNDTGEFQRFDLESGDMTLSITFKQEQLSQGINAAGDPDIEVDYLLLPLDKDEASTEEALTKKPMETIVTFAGAGENSYDQIQFEADSLQILAIRCEAADLHYEGYSFQLPENGQIALSQIFCQLEMTDPVTQDPLSAADVASVAFSDPSLVSVYEAAEGDTLADARSKLTLSVLDGDAQVLLPDEEWILFTRKAFETEETLTVTMEDGKIFTIAITDSSDHHWVIGALGDTYKVTVSYDDASGIPGDAQLQVYEITEADANYQDYYVQALEQVGNQVLGEDYVVVDPAQGLTSENVSSDQNASVNDSTFTDLSITQEHSIGEKVPRVRPSDSRYARFFNIEIWADGVKIEPTSNVSVSISLLDTPEDASADLSLVHFSEEGMEILPAQAVEMEDLESSEAHAIVFGTEEQPSFSQNSGSDPEPGSVVSPQSLPRRNQSAIHNPASLNTGISLEPDNKDYITQASVSGSNISDSVSENGADLTAGGMEFRFITDSFSVFSVMSYTVDFWYELDGAEYHIPLPAAAALHCPNCYALSGIPPWPMPRKASWQRPLRMLRKDMPNGQKIPQHLMRMLRLCSALLL